MNLIVMFLRSRDENNVSKLLKVINILSTHKITADKFDQTKQNTHLSPTSPKIV